MKIEDMNIGDVFVYEDIFGTIHEGTVINISPSAKLIKIDNDWVNNDRMDGWRLLEIVGSKKEKYG
jgi:hypothetical protein